MGRRKAVHALVEYRGVSGRFVAVCRCGFETSPAPRRTDARMLYNDHRLTPVERDGAKAVWRAPAEPAADRLREGYDRVVQPIKDESERANYDALREAIQKQILKRRWTHDLEPPPEE